nr:shikimate O-hydroxycinnamoyltransferase [Tanacetum cinerariifolium]
MRKISFSEPAFYANEYFFNKVGTQKPIVAEVSTQEPIMAEVTTKYNGEFNELARSDGQFFFYDEGIDTEYDVQSSEDAEPDVDVHLFGISMDLPFDNIVVTNLVLDDVLEGGDVDVINPDGFDSDHGNDEETNYRKIRLAELRTEMEGVINASGQWKYSFYTGHKFSAPKEAKGRVYLHSIKSRRNLKLYKNDGVRKRARCDGKVHVFTMSHGDGSTGLKRRMKHGLSGSSGPTTRSKKRKNIGTNAESQASTSGLDAHDKGDLCLWVLHVRKDKLKKFRW